MLNNIPLRKDSKNLGMELRELPPKNSSKSMIWVHINLWMPPRSPTKKEKMEALSSLMFITEGGEMGESKAENVLLVANNKNLRGVIKQQEAPPPYLPMD